MSIYSGSDSNITGIFSMSFLAYYGIVLGSFQIRFQFVMSSLDGVRRFFQRMSAYSRFYIFFQFVEGTSTELVMHSVNVALVFGSSSSRCLVLICIFIVIFPDHTHLNV